MSVLILSMFAAVGVSAAQDTVNSVFRPPKGAQFAIVVFEDLECPMCRRTAPLVEQASKTYKIPVVRHDFPLPMHPWSYQAAVMARYFDTHSKELGNQFRDYIFENQLEVNRTELALVCREICDRTQSGITFHHRPERKARRGGERGPRLG